LKKNSFMLMMAMIIIAISISYLAINKYKENGEKEEFIKYMTGSKDLDDYEKATYKERKKIAENSQAMKDMKDMFDDIKMPNIDIITKEENKIQTKTKQGTLNPEIIYDAGGNSLKGLSKGVAINARYITNTQTDEEENYYKCQKENSELKIKLDKRRINYTVLIKEKLKTKNIFLTKEETLIENKILREIAISNGIIEEERKKEEINAKEELLNQMKN